MRLEIVPYHRKDYFREEGMLFVRTEGILHTMIKATLLIAGLIVVGFTMPIQNSFGLTRSLDLIIYQDGSTHVTSEIEVDIQQPDFQIDLFGSTIDNFVAIGENGYLLESKVIADSATIQTFGSSSILVEYDIHDLISKEGRIWSFEIDASSDYSLLLPENTVIVGMSNLPQDMEILDDKSKLFLPSGHSQIDYIFGASPITDPDPTTTDPDPTPITDENPDYSLILIGGAVAAVIGLIGLSVWWKPFLQLLAGAIPVALLLGGGLALYLGFDELKDTWKKEDTLDTTTPVTDDVDKYKQEISDLKKEIETLKTEKA